MKQQTKIKQINKEFVEWANQFPFFAKVPNRKDTNEQ